MHPKMVKAGQLSYYLLLLIHLCVIVLSAYRNVINFQITWCKAHKSMPTICTNFNNTALGPPFLVPKMKVGISVVNTAILLLLVKTQGRFLGFKKSFLKCASKKWFMSFLSSFLVAFAWDVMNMSIGFSQKNANPIAESALGWMFKDVSDAFLVISLTHHIPPSKGHKVYYMYFLSLALYALNYLVQFAYCSVLAVFKLSVLATSVSSNYSELLSAVDILLVIGTSGYNKMLWDFFSTKLYKPSKDIVSKVYYPLIVIPDDCDESYTDLDVNQDTEKFS
ncbi:uncharacterized protein LOC144882281 [Branchiostoma floridae x Branchiostoma japonicum]